MFRKLSSALYQATHLQLLAALKNTKNVCFKNKFNNFKGGIAESFTRYETPVITTIDKKITIVGKEESSLDMALNCLARDLCNQICIMDYQAAKVNNSSSGALNSNENSTKYDSKFLINNNLHIKATKHFQDTKNSDLIILTRDIKDSKDAAKSFKDTVEQYTNVMNNLIPNLVKYSPNTIFLIDTDQADMVRYVAWKLSRLPKNRVLCANQINEFFSEPLSKCDCKQQSNRMPCTADVAAKIIENYQLIFLSALPLPEAPASKVDRKRKDVENKNFAQTFTSALCKSVNSGFKKNFNNFLDNDLMYKSKIII